MEKRSIIKWMLLVALFSGFSGISYSAHTMQVIPFHASDSPLEISQIQLITATNEYQILLHSKTDKNISRITFKGIIFDANGTMIGAFLHSMDFDLKANESRFINLNLEKITNSQNEAASKPSINLFNDGNAIIFIPYRVFFKPANEHQQNTEEAHYWAINYQTIHNLTPLNVSSYKKVQGKLMVQSSEPLEPPRLPCYTCQWCAEDIFSCGNALYGINCRSLACTSYYYCSCATGTCTFTCKPPDQCC